MKQRTVFVDLEETLVRSWHDLTPINHDKVEKFLSEHGRRVEIFSFAIWGPNDMKTFDLKVCPFIEREFGLHVVEAHDFGVIHDVIKKYTGVHFESYEISSIWGKARSFEDYCLSFGRENWEYVLLDDTVVDKTVQYIRQNVTLKLVRC
jgi:hypothetical protein